MKFPVTFNRKFSMTALPVLRKLLAREKISPAISTKIMGGPLSNELHSTLANALRQGRMERSAVSGRSPLGSGNIDGFENPVVLPGAFVSRAFSNSAGCRDYKLYVPSALSARSGPLPLIVMLHGCTQSPDDFAAGTRMNEIAEERGFLVAYPAQAARANGSRCWNWFSPKDQRRDGGEPSIIAGIARDIMSDFRVDPKYVFVAGLSAGGAMAVVVGAAYPELFSAVGVHSGLPLRAATSAASALRVMSNAAARTSNSTLPETGVPTITFHGDHDRTVALGNGIAISADAVRAISRTSPLTSHTSISHRDHGQSYALTAHTDVAGVPRVETWILHDGTHAWSGGSGAGSYTDPAGIDASGEMVRFFLAQAAGR